MAAWGRVGAQWGGMGYAIRSLVLWLSDASRMPEILRNLLKKEKV